MLARNLSEITLDSDSSPYNFLVIFCYTQCMAINTTKNFKYLDVITAFFVAVLIISNIASSKITQIGPFSLDGGTILFPLTYIFGDILTEVYGFKKARKVIWLGVFANILMALTFTVVGLLPSASDWPNQNAYMAIFGLTPRIVLASITAYFMGGYSNSVILSKMKIITKGRWLWTRTIGSTVVGELVDSLIFVLIAFLGVLPSELIIPLIISNYLFKTGVEVLFTPITYKVVNFLKKAENENHYDVNIAYTPIP